MVTTVLFINFAVAQTTYNSTNYAASGDVFYLTTANNYSLDFVTTGTNYTWDFSELIGVAQNELQFRSPSATGYSILIFPYIYNSNNVNLSSTEGKTSTINALGKTLGIQDINSYYKKSTADLKEMASAYKINYNGSIIPVTNEYSTPDKIYTFPIHYGDNETNNSEYTVNIPEVYYQNKTLSRNNVVDGWGKITTPFGNFSNTLRMTTTLIENDTISVLGTGVPRVLRTSRELKWLDTSKKFPILIVTQTYTENTWTTTKIQFMDSQRDFQTTALFAYSPTLPTAGTTVYFQNLSTNATIYHWDFGDTSSGTLNASTEQHPKHIFNSNGTYQVTLTASNGTYTNSTTLPVVVSDILGTNGALETKKNIIYPNPFSSYLSISGDLNNSEFELLNFEGKIMYRGNTITNQDLSYLSKGIYLLKIIKENKITYFKVAKN